MRRESRRNNVSDNNFKKILYLSGSLLGVAIIAFVVTFFIYTTKLNNEAKQSKLNTASITNLIPNNAENNDTEIASSSIGKSVEESENVLNNNVVEITKNITNATENSTVTTNESENTVATNTKPTEEEPVKDPTFIKPIEGEIIKEYAKETLVYSETLKEWITHLGIDIKADKATVVKAASNGKIKAIKNDPRYGLTIVMEHTNGFTTVYANLLSTEFVVIGEAVEQGQSIGTVGNTSTFESADDYHLHFEILKDNVQLDPSLYI